MKLNATSEPLEQSEYYKKADSFEPAHPTLAPNAERNPNFF